MVVCIVIVLAVYDIIVSIYITIIIIVGLFLGLSTVKYFQYVSEVSNACFNTWGGRCSDHSPSYACIFICKPSLMKSDS